MIYRLNDDDYGRALAAADRRFEFYNGKTGDEKMIRRPHPASMYHLLLMSCVSELAVARAWDRHWTGEWAGAIADVGTNIEVRYSPKRQNLVLRWHEVEQFGAYRQFVLTYPVTGDDQAVEIVGWAYKKHVMTYGEPFQSGPTKLMILSANHLTPFNPLIRL